MGDYYGNKYQRSWRPVSIADVNRYSVPWVRRREAEDKLDEMCFEHQLASASCALGHKVKEAELKRPPQRAPLHTQYPAFPAARACAGLSALTEYNDQAGPSRAWLNLAVQHIEPLAPELDPQALQRTVSYVTESVGDRVCRDHLLLFEGMQAVESYRLFAAAMLDLTFPRLRDVILAACTLGDLLFGLLERPKIRNRLHPLTVRIFAALGPVVADYERAIRDCKAEELPKHGGKLAKEMTEALLPFLPLKSDQQAPQMPQPFAGMSDPLLREMMKHMQRVPLRRQDPQPPSEDAFSQRLQGHDQVMPPAIDEGSGWGLAPPDEMQDPNRLPLPGSGVEMSEAAKQMMQALQQAQETLHKATSGSTWDDPRVDKVAEAIRRSLFRAGTVEAELHTRRRRVQAYGCDRNGSINEEALSRCRDKRALGRIRQGARPIEKKLSRFSWFGEREDVMVDRFQLRGQIDPRRLHRFAISELVNRRWQRHNVTDYRGRPVVVIAKDGSSSNTFETTFAGQILTMAFLRTQPMAKIRLVAADYSSVPAGPLVRWLHHPKKTPGRSCLQAADAVASLPPKGQGGNEDVLSVSHIMRETLDAIGARQTVIVINITDGKFNSPIDQVRSMVKKLKEDYDLTYSFVVLGPTKIDVPQADYTVYVPENELRDPEQIAERIARHINELVVSRRGQDGRKKRRKYYG
jgi:hypothetical protein